MNGKKSEADEKLVKMIRGNPSNPLLSIIDCRTKEAASANIVGGGGYESYENCSLYFMNIENIHEVRGSYEKLFDLVASSFVCLQSL